jgi:hypothetical protein
VSIDKINDKAQIEGMENAERHHRIFKRGLKSIGAAIAIVVVAAIPEWASAGLAIGFCVFALMNIIVALYDSRPNPN